MSQDTLTTRNIFVRDLDGEVRLEDGAYTLYLTLIGRASIGDQEKVTLRCAAARPKEKLVTSRKKRQDNDTFTRALDPWALDGVAHLTDIIVVVDNGPANSFEKTFTIPAATGGQG